MPKSFISTLNLARFLSFILAVILTSGCASQISEFSEPLANTQKNYSEDSSKSEGTTPSSTSSSSCEFNGQTIAIGQTVEAFLMSSVKFGEDCASQKRVCTIDGLTGSYQFAFCNVGQPSACLFDGKTFVHGTSVTAYLLSSVPYGSSCATEVRACNNGSLSGSYTFSTCSVAAPLSCLFQGQNVAHGQSVIAFEQSLVTDVSLCKSQTRSCNNGSLSGTYNFASCIAQSVPSPSPIGNFNVVYSQSHEDYLGPGAVNISIPDGKADLRFDLFNLKKNVVRVSIQAPGGDEWVWPGNFKNWYIHAIETKEGPVLYISKSSDNKYYRVSVKYEDQTNDSFSLAVDGSTPPLNTFPTDLPASLNVPFYDVPVEIDAIRSRMISLTFGLAYGVKVGRFWLHGSKHVQDAWGNLSPLNYELDGDLTIGQFGHDIGVDPVATELPPPGTRIWQLKGKDIVRTSRIRSLTGRVAAEGKYVGFILNLIADGPYPGFPVGGDSGSITFFRDQKGVVRILGAVGYYGTTFVAVPAQWPASWSSHLDERPRLIFNGTLASPQSIYPDDKGTDWYEGMTRPVRLFLRPKTP